MKTPIKTVAHKALGLQPAGSPLDGGLAEEQQRAFREAQAAAEARNRNAMTREAARVAVVPPPTGWMKLDGLAALADRLRRTRAEATAAEERHRQRLQAIDAKLEAASGKAVRALVKGGEPVFEADAKLRAERARSFETLAHEQDAVAVATQAISASLTVALGAAVRGLWEAMQKVETADLVELVGLATAIQAVEDRRWRRHRSALGEIGRVRKLLPNYQPARHGTPDDRVVEAFLDEQRLGVERLTTTALAIRPASALVEFLQAAKKAGYTHA
jgi:hypothetical protein